MTAITDFYDYVMPHCKGLGKFMAFQAIRDTAIDFCERTLRYRYNHPAIDVVAATSSYTLTPESGARICDILAVRYNGLPIDPANDADLDDLYADWRTVAGPVVAYQGVLDMNAVKLVRTPDASLTGGLSVEVAQAPVSNATTVPDWMFNRYRDGLVAGTLARLHALPAKPWTDNGLAVYHGHLYDQAIGRANTDKAQADTRKRLRSTPCFR